MTNNTLINKASFDGIANKFDQNIYGTTKGQLRHIILLNILAHFLPSKPLKILDAGGGTGLMAKAMLELGHEVTLVDISTDALEIANKRLKNCGSVHIIHSDLSAIDGQYDVVLCHAVLEWSHEPFQIIESLSKNVKPQGMLSLSFFNQYAKIFNNLTYGNFDYIIKGMPSKNTVRLNPHNAQAPHDVLTYLNKLERFDILETRGIRCIHDYMPDKHKIKDIYDALVAMEWRFGNQEPYKWLGKYFHIMLKALD